MDIGNVEFAPGLAFVAFSRVKSIEGLLLARDINPARLRDTAAIRLRQEEEHRLAELALATLERYWGMLANFETLFA